MNRSVLALVVLVPLTFGIQVSSVGILSLKCREMSCGFLLSETTDMVLVQ